jgi:O-antigen ligase
MQLKNESLSQNHIYPYKIVFSVFIALFALSIIGVWNRYIFDESNLPILFFILICAAGISGFYKVPRGIFFPVLTFFFIIFICYMYLRMYGNEYPKNIAIHIQRRSDGLLDITYQLVYYGLFIISALFYYKKGFSTTLWFLIAGYLLAFIGRNSIPAEWEALKDGANCSPGLFVFSLAPFLFFKGFREKSKMRYAPHILFTFCTLWVFAVHARAAAFSLLIFYVCMMAWPAIVKKRNNYLIFFPTILFLCCFMIAIYLFIMSTKYGFEEIQNLSLSLFHKSIFTRFKIWNELWGYISDRFLLGYGTESASASFAVFSYYWIRDALDAHSSYFELMLRFGVTGLVLYFAILYNIWKIYWRGRNEWVVRVAGSFLIASLFYMITSEYLLFHYPLRNGFGWIILGIGAGACLKVKHEPHREVL